MSGTGTSRPLDPLAKVADEILAALDNPPGHRGLLLLDALRRFQDETIRKVVSEIEAMGGFR